MVGNSWQEHPQEQLIPYHNKFIKQLSKYHHIQKLIVLPLIYRSRRKIKLNNDNGIIIQYCNKEQNKNMFNTYTAQKNKKQEDQRDYEEYKQLEWKIRYSTKIQPNLVNRFHRRINGFAKKMEDEPFVVKNKKDGTNDDTLLRKFDKSLNISRTNFRFKSEEDWNSIFTPIERKERKDATSFFKGKPNDYLSLRNAGSMAEYSNSKIEYRLRSKQKEINPPMKYTNRNTQFKRSALLPSLSRSKRIQTQGVLLTKRPGITVNFADSDNDRQDIMSHIDMDALSFQNSFIMRNNNKNPQQMHKTEKQLMQEQEMKALAQNRLYFKSLIDMEQHVRSLKQRHNLKEILVKCGIFKPTTGKKYQEEEIDRFVEMMKTRQ